LQCVVSLAENTTMSKKLANTRGYIAQQALALAAAHLVAESLDLHDVIQAANPRTKASRDALHKTYNELTQAADRLLACVDTCKSLVL
jgi:hypothetical protein